MLPILINMSYGRVIKMEKKKYWHKDYSSQMLSEDIKDADKNFQKEIMKEWFFSEFENPAEHTPYESREGGYIYIWGGPYDASKELYNEFEEIVEDQIIDELVSELEDETFEWSGKPGNSKKINIRNIMDESYFDTSIPAINYDIASYGADFDVLSLVERLRRDDIIVPKFQRKYVWDRKIASQFIESLLLELPIPGIFLAQDNNTRKMLVIDGQQRLKTLLYFYDCIFPSKKGSEKIVFSLINVQDQFLGFTHESMPESFRRLLDNSIIHATIVKLNTPGDDTSMIHIFERINTRGVALTTQEIRNAVYQGKFIDLTKELNDNPNWRKLFGPSDPRQRDQELIIRFLSLFFKAENYKQPLSEFLNYFVSINRNPSNSFVKKCEDIFIITVEVVYNELGKDAFRLKNVLNAAVYDSIMVSIAKHAEQKKSLKIEGLKGCYQELISNPEYIRAIKAPFSNKDVMTRISIAYESFKNCFDNEK